MDLRESNRLKSAPGDYGAKVIGKKTKKLVVPSEIFAILGALGLSTAESFHGAAYRRDIQDRLQQELALKLGWSISDFMAAASMLGTILVMDGGFDESVLYRLPPARLRSSRRVPRERRERIGT